jgi:hypothetical protein
MGIGRSLGHLHGYVRNLHNADGSYQRFKHFASSIALGDVASHFPNTRFLM